MGKIYLILILVFLIGTVLIDTGVDILNIRHANPKLPKEFEDVFSEKKYQKAQAYLKENTLFAITQSIVMVTLTILFILVGGFNQIDLLTRHLSSHSIIQGLIFVGLLGLLGQVIMQPFSIYHTFVIEEKFDFNRTTPKTYILDTAKAIILSIVIGAPLLALILWFFGTFNQSGWWVCWIAVTCFQLILMWAAPAILMPLFNKFEPLEAGALKQAVLTYAQQENVALQGIYTMDGSRRSSKSNAFFTGFGKFKRIVLYDTLIKQHSTDELVAILAHEIGHYKKHHILKMIGISIATTGLMFFVLGLFLNNPGLFSAFKMDHKSVYASLIFFGILFSPIQEVLGIGSHWLSRKHEFEADHFAATTTQNPQALINGLKKLSAENLSNLTPHPLKVILSYSHLPILERLDALKNTQTHVP